MALSSRSRGHYGQSHPSLKLIPGFVFFVSVILSMVDLPVPGIDAIPPFFALITLYFFTYWQPRFMPIWAVFICGLVYDAFQAGLFGSYALMFMIFRYAIVVLRNRTGYIEKLLYHFGIFSLYALGFFLMEWFILSMELGFNVLTSTMLKRNMLTIVLYPLHHILLSFMIMSLQSRYPKS